MKFDESSRLRMDGHSSFLSGAQILHVGDHSYSDWNEKKWDDYGSILEKLGTGINASGEHALATDHLACSLRP